jgi:ABC-type multidrug transport system fused ATPase/permease subunit
MIKQVVFTVLLIAICVCSFYVGLKPFGPLSAWQGQSAKPETEAEDKAAAKTQDKKEDEEKDKESSEDNWKSIHESLGEKTDQLMKAWGILKSVNGNVNILYTTDVKAVYPLANPLEILSPVNNSLNRTSNLFRWALSSLVFEKMFLVISVSIVFLALIPICAIISIFHVWTYKDKKALHKVVIVSVLICLVVSLAVPVSLKLSMTFDEKILSKNVNAIISSMEEIEKSAGNLNSELRRFRRTEASINSYLSTSRELSDAVIKESANYLVVFLMVNLLLPLLIIIVLYKVTRFSVKKILKK